MPFWAVAANDLLKMPKLTFEFDQKGKFDLLGVSGNPLGFGLDPPLAGGEGVRNPFLVQEGDTPFLFPVHPSLTPLPQGTPTAGEIPTPPQDTPPMVTKLQKKKLVETV